MLTHLQPPPEETSTLPPHLLPHHSLCFRTPASSSPWLTILTLLWGPQVMPPMPPSPLLSPTAYHPYAHGMPSRHASNAAYHPYTCIVPARHASNAAYHPYACSALPACLQRCLPSLRLQCHPNMPLTPLAVPFQHASNTPSHWPNPYAPAAPSR
ncbi:hypothetical protein O181_032848 [Austropuccinia psidii MF-1]|uniref:Uncharacterized protein n=1 Tax=Austropuccinia psidii MF-1 TaxID=1389203 RepID=A0A9Q3H5W4_9BASI|nr:hypothetical protein [Austropuccinia psidii MF-1]